MAKTPEWAKKLKEQGINYSVLRYMPGTQNPGPVQPQQGMLPFGGNTPMPVTISAGAGPDGIVQPDRTAIIDHGTNPASKYHEGEPITIAGNGVRRITPAQQAALGNMQFPETISQQSQMGAMPLPGYKDGGVTVPEELGTVGATTGEAVSNGTNGTDMTDGGVSGVGGAPDGYAAQRSSGGLNTVAAPSSTPSELSMAGKSAVSTGLGLLSDTAQGKNQYLQSYGNQQLAEQSAASAAGNAATLAAAKRSGASTPMLSTISQEATRSNENANNTLRSNIYSKQQEAALGAVNNLVTQGQNVRTYEDVTLPTTQQNLETAKTAAKNANRDSVYNLVKERNLAGVWGNSLVGDEQIRAQVKSMLGETATEDQINNEIGIIESALLDQNREVFNGQVDNTISDMIENGYDLEQVLADETLLKKAAGYLRINDLTSGDSLNKVKDELVTRYTELGKSDSQRAYDNVVNNVIKDTMPELMDNKDFTKDMMSTIGDLMTKGIMDAKGKVVSDAAFDWPWNDPDTYFKYHDWNGNEVYGGNYDQAQPLSVEGNGTTYRTSAGKAVSMANVNAAWNASTMSSSEREKYFDETGEFQMKKFLKDKGFKQTTPGETPLTTPDEYEQAIIDSGTEKGGFADNVDTNLRAFNSMYNDVDITTGTGETAATSKGSATGEYIYYDQYGIKQVGKVMSGDLGYIWKQMSDKAGLEDGELLSPKAFADMWKGGEGWRVDETGKVVKLWDKDSTGEANAVINTILGKKANSDGTIVWDNSYKNMVVSDSDLQTIIGNKLWETPEYSKYFANTTSDAYSLDAAVVGDKLRSQTGAGEKGKRKYSINSDWVNFANNNKGKYYVSESGKLYIINGVSIAQERDGYDRILLWDVANKKLVNDKDLEG